MTLRQMLAAHPSRFLRQTWYLAERFLDDEPDLAQPMPVLITAGDRAHDSEYTAATLVALYLTHPAHPMWDRYLWTADTDRDDQRVYVGGITNTGVLELHRHIHLSDRFARPV